MKELFTLYGRVYFHKVSYDNWEESPVLEIFDSYDQAFEHFKKYVEKAFEVFTDCGSIALNEDAVEKAKEADLFADYNIDEDAYLEDDVQWEYIEIPGESASWQMYPVNVSEWRDATILAGLHIAKRSMNPDIANYL